MFDAVPQLSEWKCKLTMHKLTAVFQSLNRFQPQLRYAIFFFNHPVQQTPPTKSQQQKLFGIGADLAKSQDYNSMRFIAKKHRHKNIIDQTQVFLLFVLSLCEIPHVILSGGSSDAGSRSENMCTEFLPKWKLQKFPQHHHHQVPYSEGYLDTFGIFGGKHHFDMFLWMLKNSSKDSWMTQASSAGRWIHHFAVCSKNTPVQTCFQAAVWDCEVIVFTSVWRTAAVTTWIVSVRNRKQTSLRQNFTGNEKLTWPPTMRHTSVWWCWISQECLWKNVFAVVVLHSHSGCSRKLCSRMNMQFRSEHQLVFSDITSCKFNIQPFNVHQIQPHNYINQRLDSLKNILARSQKRKKKSLNILIAFPLNLTFLKLPFKNYLTS